MTACARAFGITELLEQTLLHLPLKDLLLAQTVSKGWRDLTQDSKSTKRALFLEPAFDSKITYDHKLGSAQTQGGTKIAWKTVGANINLTTKPILNPLIDKHTDYYRDSHSVYILHEGLINPVNPQRPGKLMGDKLRAMHRHKASWKDMSLMQPDASKLEFLCGDQDVTGLNLSFRSTHGVTVGSLVKRLREHWLLCPNCPYMEDVPNQWTFFGDEDTNVVKADITGWEMLAEFARRS